MNFSFVSSPLRCLSWTSLFVGASLSSSGGGGGGAAVVVGCCRAAELGPGSSFIARRSLGGSWVHQKPAELLSHIVDLHCDGNAMLRLAAGLMMV